MPHNSRLPVKLLLAVAVQLAFAANAHAQKDVNGALIPGCFVSDTVYHAVIDFKTNHIGIVYGSMPLVTVEYMPHDDPEDVAGFAKKWNDKTKLSWQTATSRHVWAGHPQVSDTVIRIVSEVADVDPERIQRLLPDRFDLELTGGFRLRIMTPAGDSAKKEFAEKWHEFKGRWNPFGQVKIFEILVAPKDAQILYYALEPGTPIVALPGSEGDGK